ncbi:MAG: hypothetical protein LUF89_04340 [Ruminococcus sp.]|nr:hypothetical protein [Ruminococcus sp.]
MPKNVIVLDEMDVQIGFTYPKRAKGLMKSGRAVYVGGEDAQPQKIRLLTSPVPPSSQQEEKKMSHVINLNAREFQFDESCIGREGQRLFITDFLGNNIEIFEIGRKDSSERTQIKRDVVLEQNTDYVFRFAMTGGLDATGDAVSMFSIVPRVSAKEPSEEFALADWDKRTNYALNQSRFQPVCSKDSPNGLLRVYEIPFQTGDCTIFRFVFTAMYTATAFMPAYNLRQYASLPDISMAAWQEREKALHPVSTESEKTAHKAMIDFTGAQLTQDAYNKAMEFASKGMSIDFTGAIITPNQN